MDNKNKLAALKAERDKVSEKRAIAWATYRELVEMDNRLWAEYVNLLLPPQHKPGVKAATPKLRIVN